MVMALTGNKADLEDKRKVTADVSSFFFFIVVGKYVLPVIFLLEVHLIGVCHPSILKHNSCNALFNILCLVSSSTI